MGIVKNIKDRFPEKKFTGCLMESIYRFIILINNHYQWREQNNFSPGDFIILYAGIIGHAQALEIVIKPQN